MASIQVRRGTKAQLDAITLAAGELGFTTDDQNEVFIGTGAANLLIGRAFVGAGTGSRPAAGVAGRFFYDKTADILYLDDGTTWDTVAASAVSSVFTRSGAVIAAASDYDASQIDNDSNVDGAFVDDALNTLDTKAAPKNVIINGDMRIAQRGTSFPAIATNDYSMDRWKYGVVGTAVHTITQDSDTPNDQFYYSMKLDCTTADASIAAGDTVNFRQRIEGYNFRKFVGQTATLSYWVKAGKTGTMCVAFRNFGADRSYIVETTIDVANTWEKKTITLDFDYSGGTWVYTTGIGLDIIFSLMAGSDFEGAADTWLSTADIITSNQTNFVDATDSTCDVYITGVQLELGSVATEFDFVNQETQLANCQRYYQLETDLYFGMRFISVVPVDTPAFQPRVHLRTTMRSNPTITVSNITYNLTKTLTTITARVNGFTFLVNGTGSAGILWVRFDYDADAEL